MKPIFKILSGLVAIPCITFATGLNFQTFSPTGDILLSNGNELSLTANVRAGTLTGNPTLLTTTFTDFASYSGAFNAFVSVNPVEGDPNNVSTPIAGGTVAGGTPLWLLVEDNGETGVFYLGAAPGLNQLVQVASNVAGGIGGAGIAIGSADGSNLRLEAVPEPSSFALLAGCFGMAWVMVRRRA